MEDSGSEIDANWNISIGLSPYSNTLPGTQQNTALKSLAFTPKVSCGAVMPKSIRGSKGEGSEKNVFGGYNVYRNGIRLNGETTTDTVYTDTEKTVDKYLTYQVSAVYSVTGEKFSNKVTVVATGIDGVTSENGVSIKAEGSRLTVLGARQGEQITVCGTDGKLYASTVATDNYTDTIDLSAIAAGVYVVKVGQATFKLNVTLK